MLLPYNRGRCAASVACYAQDVLSRGEGGVEMQCVLAFVDVHCAAVCRLHSAYAVDACANCACFVGLQCNVERAAGNWHRGNLHNPERHVLLLRYRLVAVQDGECGLALLIVFHVDATQTGT